MRNQVHKPFVVMLSLMLMAATMHSQSLPELQFTHITTGDGLSSPYIRCLYQDSRGLMWICTPHGLNRYDGNSFKTYKNIPGTSNSLPNDDVWIIREDANGNFWVGTENGLCYFEPNENKFTNYFHDDDNKNSLAYTRAENIAIDDSGFVWVGSLNGLQKFNPVTKKFQLIEFATKEELAKNVHLQSVYQLYIDKKKQLWCNAAGNLYIINRSNPGYKKILPAFESGNGVNSIFEDSEGQFWVSYWGYGFAKFDGEHPPSGNDFIKKNGIYFCFAEWLDVHQNKWLVITKDDGIDFCNRRTGELVHVTHDNTKPNSFSSHASSQVLTDKDNNVWIGATRNLELLEPSRQFFQYHWLGEKKDREDYYQFGLPMPVEKYDGHYWSGLWHGKGLIKMDSNWNIIRHYKTVPTNSTANGDKTIYNIYRDGSGIYWVSTEHSFVRFDESRNNFQAFIPTDIRPDEFEFRGLKIYAADKFLVRTLHNGMYIFNTTTLRFEKHISKENTAGFLSNSVNDFIFDKQGTIWVATRNGLCSLDSATLTVKNVFVAGKPGANTHASNDCWSLAIDKANNLWITTQSGLCKFIPTQNKFITYTTASGLASNSLRKIIVDNNNNLWMNTGNGVSFFQTSTNTFRNFYREDGLPQNSLEGTINKDETGTLYFGDAGIVLSAKPNDIPFNKKKPAVIITGVLIEGKHYSILKNDQQEKLMEAVSGNSSFTVDFAVLNFNSPKLNRYYYKLEGIDNDWHESDRGIASYINVPPGSYVLRVKGSNNSGVINENGDFIRVIVKPGWFETAWFKAAIILTATLVIFYFVKRRIKNIRKESELKQKIAETEMQALRAQMNPHFIFNSLNSIENFMMLNEKRLASDYLNKFSRLIRSILDSSRNELVPVAKDMEALQLYVDLQQLRLNYKFAYNTSIEPALLQGDFKVPSMLVQPFVENAIEHGLSHSDRNNLSLKVTAVLQNDYIIYTIEDNGIGRKKSGEYNRQNKPYHKSVGLVITTDRLRILNAERNSDNSVQVTDLYNNNNEAAGTRVTLKIKPQ